MSPNVREDPGLRGRQHVFKDRTDAGRHLGRMMGDYKGTRSFILAIPAGGVSVGKALAKILSLSFDVLVVKKLQIPWEPEAGFGAVGLEGEPSLNHWLIKEELISKEVIQAGIKAAREEIRRRIRLFRGERGYLRLSEMRAIIVDDGLASGYTMLAAISEANRMEPKGVIVAVPTASSSAISLVLPHVSEVICPNIREGPYFAVADAYVEWYDLGDDEVLSLLSRPWVGKNSEFTK